MKKLLVPLIFILLPTAHASSEETVLYGLLTVILLLEIIIASIISTYLIKFFSITKKHHTFFYLYVTLGMFVFNSVFNVLYFVAIRIGWIPQSALFDKFVYLIERIIITTALAIVTFGFLRFNKKLRTK